MTTKAFLSLVALSLALACGAHWLKNKTRKIDFRELPALQVGTSADYPPYSFKRDGEIVGFDIDVAREAIKRLDMDFELHNMPFEVLIPNLQMGRIHILAAGMTKTPERAKYVDFTLPYLSSTLALVSLKKDNFEKLDEVMDKTVIVNQGYTADVFMSSKNHAHLLKLPAIPEALQALKSGRAQAFVTDYATTQPFLKQPGGNMFAIHPIAESLEETALLVSPRIAGLQEALSQSITEMISDGTIETLKKKWNL